MTKREYVKAAIKHQSTDRVPYLIDFTGDAWEAIRKELGEMPAGLYDNYVHGVGIPWWNWHQLESDWGGFEAPKSKAKVMGAGGYDGLADSITMGHILKKRIFPEG
jgi:hypothetical protein